MNGFKSFNTKKEIVIKSGITGIVGPNGSGKSNIADALRWVLGEQSSKNLRGDKMEDVIFNGSQELTKKGFCEVALTFDNSDRGLACDFDEIYVKRKMYRSGESEYSINSASCRLKDILEMFRDTGIGKEGYSIIGQGKIDEILDSKPSARRKVFEEAAGIMKFRVRKEEAERNLEKTNDNLIRIEDIINELKTQIEPLKEQMTQAKAYLEYRERLKFLEVNLFLYNCDKSAERLDKLRAQLSQNEEEQQALKSKTEQINTELAEVKEALLLLQKEIDEHGKTVAAYGTEQERLRGEYNLISEKENNLRQKLIDYEEASSENERRYAESILKTEELEAKLQEVNLKADAASQSIAELRDALEQIMNESGDIAFKYDSLKKETDALRTALEEKKLEISQQTMVSGMLEEKSVQTAQSIAAIEKEAEEKTKEKEAFAAQKDELKKGTAALLSAVNELAQTTAALKNSMDAQKAELENVNGELNRGSANLSLLENMKEGYEGYAASVRSLFNAAKSAPEIKNKLIGTFADVIDVPKEYETAIETVLGNALQNVVVQTDRDARDVIEFLRKNSLGRVTFLPLSTLKVKYINDDEKRFFNENVVGIASELISCDASVRAAADFLLGRTVVIKDIDNALKIMKSADYSFRAVTLKGDILRPGGTITGGSADTRQNGLLSRKRMAGELESRVSELKEKAKKIKNAVQTDKNKYDEYVRDRETAMVSVRKNEVEAARVNEQLSAAESACTALASRLSELRGEDEKTQRNIVDSRENKAALELELEKIQTRFETASGELESMEKGMEERGGVIDGKKAEVNAAEIEQNSLLNAKEMVINELEHARKSAYDIKTKSEAEKSAAELAKAELEQSILPGKDGITAALDKLTADINSAGAQAREKFDRRDALEKRKAECEAFISSSYEEKDALIAAQYKILGNIERTQSAKESAEARIWEEYALTYANALELKGEFSFMSATREIDEIKEALREMGAVNPNAIEDYARVNERLNNLLVQKDDLIKAGEDLKIIIKSLLGDMRLCFKEKFDMINANFKRVFRILFGGGHAEIVLMDGDIMDCGIDIICEPPGKKLQSLSLLSGGEKALCAISLVFAMLDINPSPICLLDEIDAPLDEANVVRFSEYLKELATALQFIVITHRKPTMAACDTLYGVAMHQKGVSEILSVELK